MSSIDEPQPPGTYRLVVDEEEIPGLSFLAFRRVATMLHLPAVLAASQIRQVVTVDPVELQAALDRDTSNSSERV